MTGDPLTVQGSATRPLLVGDTKCDAPAIIVDNLTEDGMIGLDSNHCTINATCCLTRNEKQVLYYKSVVPVKETVPKIFVQCHPAMQII